MQLKPFTAGLIASLFVAACAHQAQNLQLFSSNSHVQLETSSGEIFHTGSTNQPVSIDDLSSKTVFTVTFHQQGYDAKQFRLNAVNQSLYFGTHELTKNSRTLVVDPVTGALFKAKPELDRKLGTLENGDVRIISLHELPRKYRKELSAL